MVTFQEIAQKSGLRLVRSLGKKENTLWLAETPEGVSVNGVNIAFDDGKRNGLAN